MDISALFNLGSPQNHTTAANPTYQALSSNSTYSNSGNPILNGHYQPRTYLLEGFATFIKGNIRQRRYLFLFDDWLIIVKSKPNNAFQIKKKVRVAEIWVSDQIHSIHRFTKSENVMEETQKSFVIGWPLINFVVTFESIDSRNIWWCHLTNAIKIQVEREEPPLTPLKIFNWNLQCPIKAKTINITANQTGEECLKKSTALFHPQESQQQETQENKSFHSSIINSVQNPPDITLWVTIKSTEHLKVNGNNLLHHDFLDTAAPTSSVTNHHHIHGLREATPAPVKLVGFERPYAIIMNYMRQECVNAATGTQLPQSQLAKHGPINFFGATTQSSGGIYGTLSGNSQTVENIYANPSSPTSRLSSACSSHRPIDKTTSNSSSSFSLADTSIYPPSSSTSLAMKPDCSLYGNVGCNTQPSKLHLQQLLEGNMSTMLCQFSLRINADHKAKHDNQNHQVTSLGSNNNKRLSQKIKETKLIPKHKNGIYNIRRSHNKLGFAIRQPLSNKEFPENGHDLAEKSSSHSLAPSCQTVDGKGAVNGPAKNKRGVEKSPCSKSLSLNTFGIKRSHHENDDQGKFKMSSPTKGGKYTPLNMKKHTAESPFACVMASKKGGHSDVLSLGSDSSFLNNVDPSGHYHVKTDVLEGAKRSNVLYNRPLNELFLTNNNEFPKPIKKMLQLLYTYGPYTIGIFRKSSSAKLCKTIREQLDAGVEVKLDEVPMLAISSLYKEFLRNIPNGLMDSQLYKKWFQVTNTQNETEKFQTCKNLYYQLPKHNQLLLSHTLRIFKAIHDNCEYNSMTRTNLGICVGPSLLWDYSNDPTTTRTSVSSIGVPNQNTIASAFTGDAQSAKKKSKLLLNWRGACHNNGANLATPLTKSTSSSNSGFTAAMTSLLIKPSASKPNLLTVSNNCPKSTEDTPSGLESLADHENGTKWIPALIDYLITNIHAIDPTSLAHNSSFKIKFNSSKMRSNQRITTTAPLAHRASSKSSQSQSQRRALAQRLQAKNMSKRSTLNAIIYNDIGDVMKEATLLRKEEEEQQQQRQVAKLGQQCSTKALNTQTKYALQSKNAFDIGNPTDQHSKCYSNKIPLPVITVKSVGDDITEDTSKSVSSPGSAFSLPISLTRRLATVTSEPKLITALSSTMDEATQKEDKRHFDDVFETFCDRSGSALATPNDPLDPLSSATALNHEIKFVFSPTHSLSLSSLEKSDGLTFGADRRSVAPYLENNEEDEQNNCKYDEMCFDQNYLSPFRTITPLKFPSIRNIRSAEGLESKFDQRSQPSTSIISTSNGHINSCIGDSDSITNERDVYEVSSIESLAPVNHHNDLYTFTTSRYLPNRYYSYDTNRNKPNDNDVEETTVLNINLPDMVAGVTTVNNQDSNNCQSTNASTGNKNSVAGDKSTGQPREINQPYSDAGNQLKVTKRHNQKFHSHTISLVSPLTSSSRDSGLTMSDSNLYNTEPEVDVSDEGSKNAAQRKWGDVETKIARFELGAGLKSFSSSQQQQHSKKPTRVVKRDSTKTRYDKCQTKIPPVKQNPIIAIDKDGPAKVFQSSGQVPTRNQTLVKLSSYKPEPKYDSFSKQRNNIPINSLAALEVNPNIINQQITEGNKARKVYEKSLKLYLNSVYIDDDDDDENETHNPQSFQRESVKPEEKLSHHYQLNSQTSNNKPSYLAAKSKTEPELFDKAKLGAGARKNLTLTGSFTSVRATPKPTSGCEKHQQVPVEEGCDGLDPSPEITWSVSQLTKMFAQMATTMPPCATESQRI